MLLLLLSTLNFALESSSLFKFIHTVFVSRFAPTRYRGRMIAAVFFWQPVGQLLATLLALIATEGFRSHILRGKDAVSCSIHATDAAGVDCAQTVDRVWRLVSGLGAVPAAIAMVFRLTIPESVSKLPLEPFDLAFSIDCKPEGLLGFGCQKRQQSSHAHSRLLARTFLRRRIE